MPTLTMDGAKAAKEILDIPTENSKGMGVRPTRRRSRLLIEEAVKLDGSKEAVSSQPQTAEKVPRSLRSRRSSRSASDGDGRDETVTTMAAPLTKSSEEPTHARTGPDSGAGPAEQSRGESTAESTKAEPTEAGNGSKSKDHSTLKKVKVKVEGDGSGLSPARLQADHFPAHDSESTSATDHHDASKYLPSCIVQLPLGVSPGDILTIRWPTIEQSESAARDSGKNNGGKRKASDQADTTKSSKRSRSDINPQNEDSDHLLVKITIPLNIKAKLKTSHYHMKVFAPWLTAQRAAANALTARQLRTIGIDGHEGCNANLRRSRRQQIRNHGEGNFSVGHSRIGSRYQVSVDCIPSSDAWEKEKEYMKSKDKPKGVTTMKRGEFAVAVSDRMWDENAAEEARGRGEPMDQYVESLSTFQKARGVMTLHKCDYNVAEAERTFNSQTATATSIPFPDKPAPAGVQCNKPHAMLEGTPFSTQEKVAFNDALGEYRKQWPKIAKAVGTSLNRCLIHYYSAYKAGEGRDMYLKHKKRWEQSDECEVCNDGGDLLCCDGCINAYHLDCIKPRLKEVPVGQWFCADCEKKKAEEGGLIEKVQ